MMEQQSGTPKIKIVIHRLLPILQKACLWLTLWAPTCWTQASAKFPWHTLAKWQAGTDIRSLLLKSHCWSQSNQKPNLHLNSVFHYDMISLVYVYFTHSHHISTSAFLPSCTINCRDVWENRFGSVWSHQILILLLFAFRCHTDEH